MRVAVVDAYSTGRLLVETLVQHGVDCVHVPSTEIVAPYYRRSFRDDLFSDVLGYGELDAQAAVLSRLGVARVVAGTESGVRLADGLAHVLDLPGNDIETLEARRDKVLMAQQLRAAGLAHPHSARVVSADAGAAWFAENQLTEAVVKPVSSAGSDNVIFCDSIDSVRIACQQVLDSADFFGERNSSALIQERLRGREYYVNTVSSGGVHRVAETWQYTKRVADLPSPVYDYEEPADVRDPVTVGLHAYVKAALTTLGIVEGAAHSEVMITDRGPVLIETGARLGGGVLPWVAQKYSGVSQVDLLVTSIVDQAGFRAFREADVAWSSHVRYVSLINNRAGTVRTLEWAGRLSRLRTTAAVVSVADIGDHLPNTTDLATSPGYAYLVADSRSQVEDDYAILRSWEDAGPYTGTPPPREGGGVIELRELTADDWQTWRELRLAALEEAPYAFGSRLSDWVDAKEERWRARLELPGSRNFVAVLDGTPVGMASGVQTEHAGIVELISMWIAPAGRGLGIGDQLMTQVEHWARDAEAHTLQLSVADGNDRAHTLYLRSGFADTDLPGDLMPDGIHREIVMRKPL